MRTRCSRSYAPNALCGKVISFLNVALYMMAASAVTLRPDHVSANSIITFGGKSPALRTIFNRPFDLTYTFANLTTPLATPPQKVQFKGDPGSFGAVTSRVEADPRQAAQAYYIAFAQHVRRPRSNMQLTYGPRYEHHTPLREKTDRAVILDAEAGKPLLRNFTNHRIGVETEADAASPSPPPPPERVSES